MNLHEYQAKELLRRHGLPVPRGRVVTEPGAVAAAVAELGGGPLVLKAQVHAGGRGKAGGVRRVADVAEAESAARGLLGRRLVTAQNAPDGQPVQYLLLEETSEVAAECYLSLVLDRERAAIAVVASRSGGMDIEDVAREDPRAVARVAIEPAWGLGGWQLRRLARVLDVDGRALSGVLTGLLELFRSRELTLLEINPLALTASGSLLALDCKMVVDDNALFRQRELAGWQDDAQADPREVAARAHDLSYIALDGNIGCMVNGAGLAMATMDIIRHAGGSPANFLDVGGGATAENVARAFALLLGDGQVRAVLVNIFGGIMRCDVIAEGILAAVRQVDVRVPVVVRLEGTRAAEGRSMLAESGLAITAASELGEAARLVVAAARS